MLRWHTSAATAGPRADEIRVLRGEIALLLGLLLVVTAWAVFGPRYEVSRAAPGAQTKPSAPGEPSPQASALSSAHIPSFATSSGVASLLAFPGYTDPQAVYVFMLPSDLAVAWAPYASTGPATQRLISQFGDVMDSFLEAWSSGDTRDPRYTAWCLLGCAATFNALIGPWAAGKLAPIGTLKLYHESAQIGRGGSTGVVSVCVDDSALSAENQSLATVANPDRRGPTLYLFALTYVAAVGRWIALEAYSAQGSAVCTGGGDS
jgi:hypothetical protein